ncbi:hypothetical protein HUJ04_003115 [Dendroctonus ponderosae]|uniref:Poly [ADP-ribose] polymerase n=1 Tax=Dendroctonus ponderosae TaxID=77166 RepID=A0AAR5PT74_DENPD|nr:hypothetical protein HUJ04_003115 [Dendroctonus ponderosae]
MEVTKNLNFLNELALSLGEQPIHTFPVKPYLEKELSKTSGEFATNASLFRSNNSGFSIAKINSVHNIFNSLHYRLAKEKYDTVYKEGYDETLMFHGTKQDFLDGICTFNFDRSKIRTHKFGCGISFASNSFYATHYHHDNKKRQDKVMIIAKVLVGRTFEIGNQAMTIPKTMCYTSKNVPQTVIVKYDDHTFLPVAIVHYRGQHFNQDVLSNMSSYFGLGSIYEMM